MNHKANLEAAGLSDVGPDAATDGGWLGSAATIAQARAARTILQAQGYEVSLASAEPGEPTWVYAVAVAVARVYAYAANRSPTGHATALLVTLESGVWGHIPDGQRTRVAVAPGERLYATAEDAVTAAGHRWRCNGPRPRGARPEPVAIVAHDEVEPYEASLTEALRWAADAEAGSYLVEYEDTGLTDAQDPGSRCGYSDDELDQIRRALGDRDLTLTADDRGLVAQAVRQ